MEIARRDQLMQQIDAEIKHQNKVLHERYNQLSDNPKLISVKEEYKGHFKNIDGEVDKHIRQLKLLWIHMDGMLEDNQNMELSQQKKNIERRHKEFRKMKQYLENIIGPKIK